MYIKQIPVGSMQNFSYLVGEEKGSVVYIDPGWDIDKVLEIAKQDGVTVDAVLLTHSHYDHAQESEHLSTIISSPFYASKHIIEDYSNLGDRLHYVVDGEEIIVGNSTIKVLATPGHTSDAVCYLIDGALFTGDTLFIDGSGRTDLPTGNRNELLESMKKIAKLPQNTVIYPGHDYGNVPSRTLKEEMEHNSIFSSVTNPH